MKKLKINHLDVLSVVVIAQLIPMIWYGLFTEQWMELNNLTMEQIREKQSAVPYIASIIAAFFFSYTLAYLFVRLGIETIKAGVVMSVIMGFFFFFLPNIVQNLFSFRSLWLGFIDGGSNLLVWLFAGVVLGGWRKYKIAAAPADKATPVEAKIS